MLSIDYVNIITLTSFQFVFREHDYQRSQDLAIRLPFSQYVMFCTMQYVPR